MRQVETRLAAGRFGMMLEGQRSVVDFGNLTAQHPPNTGPEEIARKLEETVSAL